MAQITKRGATQSIFDKTALQELLPFDRITEMQCWCYVPLWALMGAPGGIGLRQCSGEKSIFFNNATNELLFGRKHCFYDLNIKMVHFCTFIMRLLWKLGKIAAILDSRRRKKRSQFWIFCYQIFNISKKLQYLQTDQRDFWNFEKKSIFLFFCQKWHKNMRFFIVFRIPFRN